jgi:hypothetical protein
MTKKKDPTLGWWSVRTEDPSSDRAPAIYLGTYYGHVDRIALDLAGYQTGFWCDGKLSFRRVEKPTARAWKPREKVNVVVEEGDRLAGESLAWSRKFFAGRPVEVSECNLYAAVTLIRKKGRKR